MPLEGEQGMEYLRLMREDSRYQETTKMILTTYDRGMAAGKRVALRGDRATGASAVRRA